MRLIQACNQLKPVRTESDTHLVDLRTGQTAGQRPAVSGQRGGEGWAAVSQDGLQVAERLLRKKLQQLLKDA